MSWFSETPGDWKPIGAEEVAQDFEESGLPYKVDVLIGHGGQAAVYAATDMRTGRRVAVKMLRYYAEAEDPQPNEDSDYLRRFRNEITALQRVKHSNIVEILDSGGQTQGGYDYFVMEYLEGKSLYERLQERRNLTVKQGADILMGACAGLEAIHAAKLVHRDLKPANIFLCSDGRVVVLDLGVARDSTQDPGTLSSHGSPGTPGYIAPEVKKREHATNASDIYALGVIMLEMSMGEKPDVGHHRPSEFGWPLDEVVAKSLSPDPSSRYPNVADLRKAISHAMTRPSADQTPPPSLINEGEAPVTPAIPRTRRVKRVQFPDSDRKRRHLAVLVNIRPKQVELSAQSSAPSPTEEWKVEEQWPAFPDFPSFEATVNRMRLRRTLRFAVAGGVFCVALLAGIVGAISHRDLGYLFVALFWGLILGSVGGISVVPRVFDWALATFTGHWDMNTDNHWHIKQYWGQSENPKSLDPHQLFWHSAAPYVYVTRDHENLVSWHLEQKHRDGPHVNHPKLFTVGNVTAIFFSESLFMTQTESFWWWNAGAETDHWFIYERNGEQRCRITGSKYSNFGGGKCNPLRPNPNGYGSGYSSGELLVAPSASWIGLLDVASIPTIWRIPNTEAAKEHTKVVIDLRSLSDRDSVRSFAWHPNGQYLAIEMGGWLHILHWDSASVVASQEPRPDVRYESLGWSPDGTLLALDDRARLVWDARTDQIRQSRSDEQWRVQIPGNLETKLKSCDALRRFDGRIGVGVYPTWGAVSLRGEQFTDVAWSPTDPNVFISLGGEGFARDLRLWRRIN